MIEFHPSTQALQTLKSASHQQLPRVKSTHLAEALAAALGYRTYAALRADFAGLVRQCKPIPLDPARFTQRLHELGYLVGPIQFEGARGPADTPPQDPTTVHVPFVHEVAEQLGKSPAERCWGYGVRIERDPDGTVWVRHVVAGVLGPFNTEAQAAQEACAVWGL